MTLGFMHSTFVRQKVGFQKLSNMFNFFIRIARGYLHACRP